MKRILLLIVALTLLPFAAGWADYAIVNNSTSSQTAHDSLSIPFFLLDSAGNQVAIASGDSVHLIVWYPGGAVAAQDSGAYDDGDITAQTRHGMSWYSWQAQVSDLDGTPTEGTYKYHFSVHDKTSAALWTTFTGSFQLYVTADFDVALDEIAAALDTLQNQDNWGAAAAELTKVIDSINAILDTLQLYDGRYALAAELTKTIDSVNAILDTLQLYDGRYALAAELTKAVDSINALLDTLQLWDTRIDSIEAALADAKLEKVWYGIDTTNIDTSEIGEWFSTGISASLSDANMGAIADSVWDKIYADMVAQAGGAGDSLWAILNDLLDTLQNHDNWVAKAAELTKAIDSINAILDTLQLYDVWVATEVTAAKALDSLADILDSLESHDDWIAAAANLTKAIDSINALLDTLQLWDSRIDSIEAALADGSIGDKVWTDAVTRAITAGVLTASEWEKVWHDIDTTNIDTSEIGEWFSTGIAASLSDANIGKIADSTDSILSDAHGAGTWTTGTGSGDNALRYYAVDTSGTDEAIMEVQITMKTIADVFDAAGPTNANGYRDFTAPTDSMIAYGRKLGYYFPYDTNNITGTLTDTLLGYNVPLQASPEPNLCRVQGYVFVPGGAPEKKITVTFTVAGEAVHNSCDSTAFIAEPVIEKTKTHADSLGFFYADLVPSGCLLKADGDSLQYLVTQELDGVKGKEKLIWVLQAESMEIVW